MSENPTVNLSALCNSCEKIACCSSELFFTPSYRQQHPKCERAIRLVCRPSFCKLRSPANTTPHPPPKKTSNGVRSRDSFA